MRFWLEFFADRRFGRRFKIANFIMGDYLRNYLACGCVAQLRSIVEITYDDAMVRRIQKRAEKAMRSVIDVMEM